MRDSSGTFDICPQCGVVLPCHAHPDEQPEPRERVSFAAHIMREEGTKAPPCQWCGGPHLFDTSVPSVRWNAVVRARGLPDALCLSCIVAAFAEAGESFTATLWSGSDGPFDGLPIEIRIGNQAATDAATISNENTALRARLAVIDAGIRALSEKSVSTRLIVSDHARDKRYGHNPSWVKVSDLSAVLVPISTKVDA